MDVNAIDVPAGTRGLVFDLDGTLADTMPLHCRAWEKMLAEQELPFDEAELYALAGTPTLRICEIYKQRHGWALDPARSAARKAELYHELLEEIRPIETIVAIARRYRGVLPMAVATGGSRRSAGKTIEAAGLEGWFDAVVTCDDVVHGKPAPDTFLLAAERLGVPASACVAFEDGDVGIESARAAGMHVIDVRPLLGE
jgi:beta-phosphoglucomutase family hydrolase